MSLELCALLWPAAGQEQLLGQYEDAVLALLPRHGGKVVSRVRRVEAGDGPLEVQVIHLPDEAALHAYMQDPDRRALADVHRRAIARTELLTVETVV